MRQLIITEDGSHSIYVPELDENYHSIHGAVQESEHVFIKNGFDVCDENPVTLFEAGFGTGLNALFTAIRGLGTGKEIFYTAIEKYPLDNEIVKVLNYPAFAGEKGKMIFDQIHSCEWGKLHKIVTGFYLTKIEGDLVNDTITGSYNLVYFDAFAPDKQPEMWTKDVFRKISQVTAANGIFVTYSAKGDVKRNLEGSGFRVSRLPGPPGKRHMIRAIKSY